MRGTRVGARPKAARAGAGAAAAAALAFGAVLATPAPSYAADVTLPVADEAGLLAAVATVNAAAGSGDHYVVEVEPPGGTLTLSAASAWPALSIDAGADVEFTGAPGTTIDLGGVAGPIIGQSGSTMAFRHLGFEDPREPDGSAAFLGGVSADLTIADVRLAGSGGLPGDDGSAITVDGGTARIADTTIDDALLGVEISGDADATIGDVTITGAVGAGIAVEASAGTVTISDVAVAAPGECGLAAQLTGDAVLDVTRLRVDGAACAGVDVAEADSARTTIRESTLSGNETGLQAMTYDAATVDVDRSAILASSFVQANLYVLGGEVRITDSTISGGTNDGNPALAALLGDGAVTIARSTITGNAAADYPVVDASGCGCGAGTLALLDTVVGGNVGTSPSAPDLAVPAGSAIDWSLVEFVDPTDADTVAALAAGTGNVEGIDPGLGPLADNGGPTPSHLPVPGSPVVSGADPAFAVPGALDQRGEPRVSGGRLDIGAVEAQFPGAPTGLTATPGAGEAALGWTPPTDSGDAALSGYVVEFREAGAAVWSTFSGESGTTPSATVTGLGGFTAYEFRVAAESAYGTGPFSAVATAVEPLPPTGADPSGPGIAAAALLLVGGAALALSRAAAGRTAAPRGRRA